MAVDQIAGCASRLTCTSPALTLLRFVGSLAFSRRPKLLPSYAVRWRVTGSLSQALFCSYRSTASFTASTSWFISLPMISTPNSTRPLFASPMSAISSRSPGLGTLSSSPQASTLSLVLSCACTLTATLAAGRLTRQLLSTLAWRLVVDAEYRTCYSLLTPTDGAVELLGASDAVTPL